MLRNLETKLYDVSGEKGSGRECPGRSAQDRYADPIKH